MRININTTNFGDPNNGMFGGNSNQMSFSVPTTVFDNNQRLTISGERLYDSINQFSWPNRDKLILKVQNSTQGGGLFGYDSNVLLASTSINLMPD